MSEAVLQKGGGKQGHYLSLDTLRESPAVKTWFAAMRGTPITERNHVSGLQTFTDYVRKTPDELVEERKQAITSQDWDAMGKAEQTLNQYFEAWPNKNMGLQGFRAMKSFYRYHRMELKGIKTPNQESLAVRQRDHIPTEAEIARMCDASDIRDKLVLMIGAQTGMRVGSLVKLQYRHLKDDFEAGRTPCRVIIPLYEREYYKDQGVMTFILEDTIKVLRQYIEFRKSKGEQIRDDTMIFDMNDSAVSKIVKKAAILAGVIPADARGVTDFRFHCFRKRVQTILEGSGVPLNWVDTMLAHKPRGSQGNAYVRPSEEELREAHKASEGKLTIYGRRQESATVDEVRKESKLAALEFAVEHSLVRDRATREIFEEAEKVRGRPLSIDEKITALEDEYAELRKQEIALMERGVEDVLPREPEFEWRPIPREELQSYLDQGWEPDKQDPPYGWIVRRKREQKDVK